MTQTKNVFFGRWDSDFNANTPITSRPPEVFLGKEILKICSKFTGEHTCWKVSRAVSDLSNRNLKADFYDGNIEHFAVFIKIIKREAQKTDKAKSASHTRFSQWYYTLLKIPWFHQISWCRNFVERHSFRIVSA